MNNEPLLKVERLCQYFKTGGNRVLKAVDDVSFDIKKGEVFSLVGESGCGKTTTGRSIIRLYDITGGSVYFNGKRICAGTKWYRDGIEKAKADLRSAIRDAKGDKNETEKAKAVYAEEIKKQKSQKEELCPGKDTAPCALVLRTHEASFVLR